MNLLEWQLQAAGPARLHLVPCMPGGLLGIKVSFLLRSSINNGKILLLFVSLYPNVHISHALAAFSARNTP